MGHRQCDRNSRYYLGRPLASTALQQRTEPGSHDKAVSNVPGKIPRPPTSASFSGGEAPTTHWRGITRLCHRHALTLGCAPVIRKGGESGSLDHLCVLSQHALIPQNPNYPPTPKG